MMITADLLKPEKASETVNTPVKLNEMTTSSATRSGCNNSLTSNTMANPRIMKVIVSELIGIS
jgi:hypothetical protein